MSLRSFRKANKLTQEDVARYLGVGQGFISQIEKGSRPLPEDAAQKIKSNPEWDSTTLMESPSVNIRNSVSGNGSANAIVNSPDASLGADQRKLNDEIAALRKELELVTAERDRYWDMIQKMMK